MSTKKKKKRKKAQAPPAVQEWLDELQDWSTGKLWWPRLLLLLFFIHLLVSHIKDPMYSDIFKGLNLGIHEIGHMVFAPLGEFMTVAGGSLLQCLVPLLSPIMFFRQRDYFGMTVCFAWLSTNLFDVAVYADDARALALPLVTPFKGDETIHDWNFMLDKLDLMAYDHTIAGILRISAILSMVFAIATGFYLVFLVMKNPKTQAVTDPET